MPRISDNDLTDLLLPGDLVRSVYQAMVWDEQNPGNVPQRMHLNRGEDTFLLMPAFGPGFHGTKLVSVLPENRFAGRPVISGTYLLYDSTTGEELLTLNAGTLTALRTGAIAAVAADHLSRPDIDSIGIIGCGVQGTSAARLIASIRPVKSIYAYSRRKQSVEQFEIALNNMGVNARVIPCDSGRQLLEATDTLVLATTSNDPVLPEDERLISNKTIIALGAYRTNMRELPDVAHRLAGCLVIDAEGTRRETGDVLYPVENNIFSAQEIYTLGKVILGLKSPEHPTRVFKSAGYALFDLFTAIRAWEKISGQQTGIFNL